MNLSRTKISAIYQSVRPCAGQRMNSTSQYNLGRAVKLAYASTHNVVLSSKPQNVESPLVIIHGLFGSKRNWESLSKAFSRSGRKVITVDVRNHGDSPHVDEMNYEVMSEDLALLLSDLGIQKAHILGHSMGGKLAMTLALTKPELIDKLIIEDVSPDVSRCLETSSFPQYIETMKSVTFDHNDSIIKNRKLADAQLAAHVPDKGVRNFMLMNVEQGTDGKFRWKVNLDAIYDNLEALIAFPDLSATYDKETLFIGGRLSEHISEKGIPNIKRFFPSSRIEFIEGSGHWVHAEKPVPFLHLVNSFLQNSS